MNQFPAHYWVKKYDMQPHPEGGYFTETYRSEETIAADALPKRFGGERNFGTAIYFLLENYHFSALHRIASDEIWHFYAGDALEVFCIDENANLEIIRLGNNPEKGEVFQAVVKAGTWFGSRPATGSAYSLVGCTVAPGFDFSDFEMPDQKWFLKKFPQHKELIVALTRES
ncbi:MAG: cupin domain-containing protein [Spirosomaceae bacterium]|nr:cupin domain-containing protein [Spirosomataceae bacterium]